MLQVSHPGEGVPTGGGSVAWAAAVPQTAAAIKTITAVFADLVPDFIFASPNVPRISA